jgi:hypothetical protein
MTNIQVNSILFLVSSIIVTPFLSSDKDGYRYLVEYIDWMSLKQQSLFYNLHVLLPFLRLQL